MWALLCADMRRVHYLCLIAVLLKLQMALDSPGGLFQPRFLGYNPELVILQVWGGAQECAF